MTKRTLLTKADRQSQLNQIEKIMKNLFENLDVTADIAGVIADRWVQVDISGEDEGIATNYISREIGFCPERIGEVDRFATLKGYVTNTEDAKEGLIVDIGVYEPTAANARIPLNHLRAQLADGKALEFNRIAEIYGLSRDLPIEVKVKNLDPQGNYFEAELAKEQISKYKLWIESLMDRLIVIGATKAEIHRALNYSGLKRDIIEAESLGIFEHTLTCKLGTDAVGLIPTIGRSLRNARIIAFNSRENEQSLISLKP